jgi:transcriptional regulator with XRE-family HTH domain
MKTYPNSLRKHRKAAGLCQHEVARALGLGTIERISKWENGLSIPRGRSLFQLAQLYQVPPQQLFSEIYQSSPTVERAPEPQGFTMVSSPYKDGEGPFRKKGPIRRLIQTSPSTYEVVLEERIPEEG